MNGFKKGLCKEFMRLIKIIAVGKLKEKYWTQSIAEYVKRLSRFCKLEIIEVEDEKMPREANAADIIAGLKLEGDRLKLKIKDRAFVFVLDVQGDAATSERFAETFRHVVENNSEVVFIIGGSTGLHPEVLSLANSRISLSKLTFPHQMARLILVEQIFRAFKINSNETYHK